MRYRLTKLQIKMLAEGKSVCAGRVVIYPDSKTRINCKYIIETGMWDRYDFFIDDFTMTCERKNT